jgi:glycine betaine/proline transport system substrate-binding protein
MTRNSTISKRGHVFRRSPEPRAPAGAAALTRALGLALALSAALACLPVRTLRAAVPLEADSCRSVRLADVGWSDVTATTALLSTVLRDLGYEPRTTLLSVPVTFASMQAGNIDVFLGNWMPAQTNDRRPYIEDGSIEVVRENLSGAKYTLAVPAYTYAAGLKDFADIQRFAGPLHATIYGIEAGNDGNHHILTMIQNDDFGLGSFRLVESSEQGMLGEVARAYAAHAPIVFLAWDPHPMNMRFDLRYLSGGDSTFGPDYGGASVLTLARAGYLAQCPNVARLLRNLQFTTRGESELMQAMLTGKQPPEKAARAWLDARPAILAGWLQGVVNVDGRSPGALHGYTLHGTAPAFAARFEPWLAAHKLPLGDAIARGIDGIKHHGSRLFALIATVVGALIAAVSGVLHALPAPLLILGAALLAWTLQRSWWLAGFVAAALLFIMNQGYWQSTLDTLSLVAVATLVSALIGVPLGIAAAHRPRLQAALRPVLDLMQTLPTFVYLIPTLVLFGLGVVPALISTVIFALPAPIRLTQLGISEVPRALLEAGEAFGATRWQLLVKVELPSAAPLILAGITQCIMLSLSMVVIGALVGAGGLGVPVVRALNSVQIGMGVEAGFAIVLLAVILDRITRIRRAAGNRGRSA